MPAIRWDNVNGPSLAQAAAPIAAATQTFNNAFGELRDVLKERQSVDDGNWQNQKTNNTSAFLDAVSKYTDPDKLKAAQADPNSDLNKMRAQFGNQVDMDKVRGAADARMSQTMQQARDAIAYQDVMRNEKTAPLVDQYRDAVMRKDDAGAQAARASYLAAGGRNASDLDIFADHRQRELVTRQQGDESHLWNINKSKSSIQHDRAEEDIGRRQASASELNARSQAQSVKQQGQFQEFQMDTAKTDRATAKAAGMAQALKASLGENGNLYAEGRYTGGQADVLRKFMKDSGIGGGNVDKEANVIRALNDVLKEGVAVTGPNGGRLLDSAGKPVIIRDIPMTAVKAAVAAAKDDLFHFKGWNGALADNVREALSATLSASVRDDKGNLDSKALVDLQTFNNTLQNARDNAAPIRSQGAPITQTRRK